MQDEEVKFKVMLVAGIFFLISAYFSWQELRYSVWGKETEAVVGQVRESTSYGRRGRRRQHLSVQILFSEAGGAPRMESLSYPIGSSISPMTKLPVQYIPGVTGLVREAGSWNALAVFFFIGSCLFLIGGLIWISIEANRPIARTPKRRKRKEAF